MINFFKEMTVVHSQESAERERIRQDSDREIARIQKQKEENIRRIEENHNRRMNALDGINAKLQDDDFDPEEVLRDLHAFINM